MLPEGTRERFGAAVESGLSPTAAATVAGVCGATGRRWAAEAGYQTDPRHYGLRYSAEVREGFWAALRSGSSVTEAALVAGVSEHAGRRWVQQAGYVPRTQAGTDLQLLSGPAEAGTALSFEERCWLEELLEAGYQPGRAADRLGRHRSTIGREIKRGQTNSGYRARVGQDVVERNRRRPKRRKLDSSSVLLAEVVKRLEQRHSPEQIGARLREDFPDDPEMWVSHETIYQAMYVQPRGVLANLVKTALRTEPFAPKTAGPQDLIGDRNRFKAGMIGISERPAEAEDRAVRWPRWDGDLILGSTASRVQRIGTMVERTTGFTMLLHLDSSVTRTAAPWPIRQGR